jgi:hypothetical protein
MCEVTKSFILYYILLSSSPFKSRSIRLMQQICMLQYLPPIVAHDFLSLFKHMPGQTANISLHFVQISKPLCLSSPSERLADWCNAPKKLHDAFILAKITSLKMLV